MLAVNLLSWTLLQLGGWPGVVGHSGTSRVSERVERTEKERIMPEILFPDKWWQLPQEDYNSAKAALKGLISKDPDSGSAEVIIKIPERRVKREEKGLS